jgi:hypothetical protein
VTRLMCWMHVIIKNFLLVMKKIGGQDILDDTNALRSRFHIKNFMAKEMQVLHQCSTYDMFQKGCTLWKEKYVTALKETEPLISNVSIT